MGESHEDLTELTAIDTTKAHAARIYDYLLGGTDNFPVDRDAAEQAAALQGGLEIVRTGLRMHRDYLGRAVRYLVGEGVRQFLDIGTGIPSEDNVHGVALGAAPDCRIVYVDRDPVVLAHAHRLLQDTPRGATDYLRADLRDPETILDKAAATLDFTRPVGLVLVGILHFIADDEDPYGIVAQLVDAVAPGSYLAVSHLTADIRPEETRAMVERYNERTHEQFTVRSHDEVARFYTNMTLREPGIVPVSRWHPHGDVAPSPETWLLPAYGAVGRKD